MTEYSWDGLPENPRQDGWHWLTGNGQMLPMFWNSKLLRWEEGGLSCRGYISPEMLCGEAYGTPVIYVGPCIMVVEKNLDSCMNEVRSWLAMFNDNQDKESIRMMIHWATQWLRAKDFGK